MLVSKGYKLVCGVLFYSLILSSCTKENSVIIQEEVENLEIGVRMSINGHEIFSNAFVSYCADDDQEYFAISNREKLFDASATILDFEANDYYFYKSITAVGGFDYGGIALNGEVIGLNESDIYLLSTDSEINITSNDGILVEGNANGTLYYFDPLNPTSISEFPYTIRFVGLIIEESDYCN